MINLNQSDQESVNIDVGSRQNTVVRHQFRNYAVYYNHVKSECLEKIKHWIAMIKSLSKQKEGFQSTQVLHFLTMIEEKDSDYQLHNKQFLSINKEIVEMFKVEVDRILSENDNEYQIISQQNSRMFKELNRLNQFNERLCVPQWLIGLDIYSCLHEINYLCKNSQPSIPRLITAKTICDMTGIQQIKTFEITLKPKWEENFCFINKEIKQSLFGVLSEIVFLVHLRRKLTSLQSKDATLSLNDIDPVPFQFKYPEEKYAFRNSNRFKYKFCELAVYYPKDMTRKSHLIKSEIARRIEIILQRSQESDQCLELRETMLQYKITFKSLSEWIDNYTNSTYPKPKQILENLEKCQWGLLKNDSFDGANKSIQGSKEALSSQNFIGQSICKIALERYRKYAFVLKIQNRLMTKVEKGASLYIRRFKYSYREYYYIHHKDTSGSTCASLEKEKQEKEYNEQNDSKEEDNLQNDEGNQDYGSRQQKQALKGKPKKRKYESKKPKTKESSKISPSITIIIGFSQEKDQFAFKFDEQLQEAHYIQHLVCFLKTKHDKKYNVFLSEMDFQRNGLFENNLIRMIELFKANLHNFVKFQASPSKFFYHLLVHSYVDKCLSQTSFENQSEFSQIISSATLQIIRLINYNMDTSICQKNIKDDCNGPQEQSCEQSDEGIIFYPMKKLSENTQGIYENYPQIDKMKIRSKIRNILMKKQSTEDFLLNTKGWQGVTRYTKKGNTCQYYLKEQDQNNQPEDKKSEEFASSLQDSYKLEQEISDLQHRIQTLLENNWPFLTDLQITNKIKNLVSFLKEINSGTKEIKSLIRNIARNLIIYQAYFNELFCSKSEQSKELKERYWKQISFLASFYNKQVENIDKELPGNLYYTFMKLLSNFVRFPITLKKISSYCNSKKTNTTSQTALKVQYKEQEDYPEPFKRFK